MISVIINFNEIKETRLTEFKRGTGTTVARMYVDEKVRIMKGYLEPGSSIGMHTHEGSSETIFILAGEGKTIVDGKEELLRAGSCSHCPNGSSHTLINSGKGRLEFYAVVPQV